MRAAGEHGAQMDGMGFAEAELAHHLYGRAAVGGRVALEHALHRRELLWPREDVEAAARVAVGEGIEKKKADLAADVAATLAGAG